MRHLVPNQLCLRNTALVFAYLVFLDRVSFVTRESWGGMLLVSIMLYLGALAAHANPELLLSLYSRP